MIHFTPQDFCPVGIGGTKYIDTRNLKVFVGNVPHDTTSQKLFDFFKTFGAIREAVVIADRFRVRSRGYGFVTFVDQSSVQKVLALPQLRMGGQLLNITLAWIGEQPRRSNFVVRHGHNGHKLLKEFSPRRRYFLQTQPLTHDNSCMYRTANIQAIDAVGKDRVQELELAFEEMEACNVSPSKEAIEIVFPNKDIEKDFKVLSNMNMKALKSEKDVNVTPQKCLTRSPMSHGHKSNEASPFLDLRKVGPKKKQVEPLCFDDGDCDCPTGEWKGQRRTQALKSVNSANRMQSEPLNPSQKVIKNEDSIYEDICQTLVLSPNGIQELENLNTLPKTPSPRRCYTTNDVNIDIDRPFQDIAAMKRHNSAPFRVGSGVDDSNCDFPPGCNSRVYVYPPQAVSVVPTETKKSIPSNKVPMPRFNNPPAVYFPSRLTSAERQAGFAMGMPRFR